MELKDALLAITNYIRFPEEQEKLDVQAAIIEHLTVPEPVEYDDAELVGDDVNQQ